MKNSAKSNMYEANADEVWQKFGPHLAGNHAGLWCVVSEHALGETAHNALASSAAALGFGDEACTFVTLTAQDDTLSANDLFTTIEGIDPVRVVAADAASAHALEQAYHQKVPADDSCRLFGRDAVSFRSFENLMDSAQNKQTAWALIKKLPRITN